MPDFLGFGDNRDGDLHVTTIVDDTVIDSVCSGSSGSTSLTATNPSFSAGQMVLIIQMTGTGAGNRQFNRISSYTAGTITLEFALDNNFGLVGSAQVLVIKQLTSLTIDITKALGVKYHDEATHKGGIFAAFVNGPAIINGDLTANGGTGGSNGDPGLGAQGRGYWGGDGARHTIFPDSANYGGSSTGISSRDHTRNNNGAGGGAGYVSATGSKAPAGGGGHAGPGQQAVNGSGSYQHGLGGDTIGNDDMSVIFMGAGGGGGCTGDGSSSFKTGGGGGGAGIIILFARKIVVTGRVMAIGGDGGAADVASGGGGAGGSIWLKGVELDIGTGLVDASAGNYGDGGSSGAHGGAGSVGRVKVECCTLTGESTPAALKVVGGHSYCFSGSAIL